MSDELTAAYIAAVVSIIGIGINIIVAAINRSLDGIEKRKNNRISAIEQYYAPLSILIDDLIFELCQFEKAIDIECTTDDLIKYLSNSESVPVAGLHLVDNIKLKIKELCNFFKNNKYQYFPDYPLKQLHDLVHSTVEKINQGKEIEVSEQKYITKDFKSCLELFHKRLSKISVKLFTHNPLRRLFPLFFLHWNNLINNK